MMVLTRAYVVALCISALSPWRASLHIKKIWALGACHAQNRCPDKLLESVLDFMPAEPSTSLKLIFHVSAAPQQQR